jgi:mannonate dehydratase
MKAKVSRRKLMQAAGVAALAAPASSAAATMPGPRFEGKDTPKIALEPGLNAFSIPPLNAPPAGGAEAGRAPGGQGRGGGMNLELAARRIKQLGVDHVLGGGGRIPWEEDRLREQMERYKSYGLTLGNLMIGGFNNAVYGRPARDQEIENVIKSIRAAGKVGLPVIEYNWYAHRATEGYFEETGRSGSGWTGFDYARVKDLPPRPEIGTWTADQLWANITYFLKAVIPEAEKAGVRLALHPNDPPAPLSRGSQQIMATLAGWKKLIEIVKSPSNGITFDCGVTRELGEDPVEVCRYFGSRDRINHVHFRNVKVQKPYERYTEVAVDEGENNMFAVMKELVKQKYTRQVYPEHARGLDYDRERPNFRPLYAGGGGYAGFAFAVGYTRAMLQAALTA